jgi:hypothetical protein
LAKYRDIIAEKERERAEKETLEKRVTGLENRINKKIMRNLL